MDNRTCKNIFLAKIMLSYLDRINSTVAIHRDPKTEIKPDNSPVTQLDLALSSLVEEIHALHFSNSVFYSEEKFSSWGFPLLALDPLDGTREYIKGRPEWALSIGLLLNDKFQGEGWIYNPLTGECFADSSPFPFQEKAIYCGEVSRTEWESGLFTKTHDCPVEVRPMGSIAYKLGRLSQRKTDFVISLRPKNIWDIAGGTILCQKAGFKFYAEGKMVTRVEKSYRPPLIWCHEELFPILSETFV